MVWNTEIKSGYQSDQSMFQALSNRDKDKLRTCKMNEWWLVQERASKRASKRARKRNIWRGIGRCVPQQQPRNTIHQTIIKARSLNMYLHIFFYSNWIICRFDLHGGQSGDSEFFLSLSFSMSCPSICCCCLPIVHDIFDLVIGCLCDY